MSLFYLTKTLNVYTVNVEIFAQYIFSRMVSDARKNDVSENINHYRLDEIRYSVLNWRKYVHAKMSHMA